MGKRGRPVGHKLSEESKRAIAESKRGQHHKQATKDKISKSLLIYFSQFNSLSEEITNKYCRTDDDELCQWAEDVRDELDESEDIFTNKTMRNTRRTELTSGQHIEFYSHNLTPELLIMLKDMMENPNFSEEEILENLF